MKDYTIGVYSKSYIPIYDSNGKTGDVTQNLMNSLSSALNILSTFTLENGGWYAIRRGYMNGGTDTFFYQVSGPMKVYNMNFTVTFTSTGSTVYTTAKNTVTSVKNSDGTTTHTHNCQILPK